MDGPGAIRYATAVARDAAYVTVGFGVLGFQQLQVRRRELESRIERGEADGPLDVAAGALDGGIRAGRSVLTGLLARGSG